MRNAPINLIGGSNVDDSLPWLCEDTVNYVIEKAPSSGALTEYKLRDAPGLKPYVKGPLVDGNPAGPVRGSHDCEGKHFTVMGSVLYQITPSRIAIPLGTVPGTQRVNMSHNQIPGGNEVIVTTGTPNGYVYNTVTDVFGRITDPGYPGGGSVDYLDTYLLSVEPYGRYWYWSDQASATSYNTLNRTEAEADPDSIVALAVNAFEVVVFGQQSLEFFYNAGGINGNTFKSKRVMNGHGCAARDSVVKLDNTLFWLSGDGIVYRLNGYAAQPISTPQFTQRIQGLNWSKAFAYAYEDQGHVMYWITFPDGETFCFDVPVAAMTRRESYGLTRCRLNTLIKTAGKWIGGDFQSGLLYEMDWDYPMEGDGTNLVRQRTSGNTWNAQNKIETNLVELIFETGSPQVEPVLFVDQPEGPTLVGDYPDGVVGELHASFDYTATGGTPPYTFLNRPGNNPAPGIPLMGADGEVAAGTPTTAGNYSHAPRVRDVNGLYDDKIDPYVIAEAPIPWLALVNNANGLMFGLEGDWSSSLVASPGGETWQVAGYGNGEILLNNRSDNVAWSDDFGATWTVSTLPATVNGNKGYLYYAFGYWWVPSGTLTEVQRGDGVTFTQPVTGSAAAQGETIASVTIAGDDILVMAASSQSKASRSLDYGASWAFGAGDMKPAAAQATRVGLASNGTRIVVAGSFASGGPASYSDDGGNTWSDCTVPVLSGAVTFVTYRGGKFIFGDDNGDIHYSTDGVTFVAAGATSAGRRCQGIDYDGTRYTAVFSSTPIDGYMCESLDDMATWAQVIPSSGTTQFYSIIAMTP